MFGTIRRHQSWLWIIIVVVIIISFVVYFDPSVQSGGGRGGYGIGKIDGRDITPTQFRQAEQETRLLYFLNFRKWPEQDETAHQRGFDLEREATLRLVRVNEARQAGIRVADTMVAEMAKRLLGDFPLARFEQEQLRPAGLTADDFERFVRNDVALQQLSTLQGLAGRLVVPAEAEMLYRRENEAVSGAVALFNVSNYLGRIAVTNQALTSWYSNQMARYRTPEKVTVTYVSFPATNFLAEANKQIETVTNLTMQLNEIYMKEGTNAFKDTNGNVLPREKAIAKIKEDQTERLAHLFARRNANEFANRLYDEANKGDRVNPAALEELAKKENLPVAVSQPFDMEQGPTNLNVSPNFVQAAFSLDATNNPIAFQPIEGENGYYLIALKSTVPSRPQSFEEVKQKVADDYKLAQAFMMLQQDARAFQTRITNALAEGKKFTEVAAQAGAKVVPIPSIARNTESLTNLNANLNVRQIRSVLFSLEPGKASGFIPNPPEGGYVAYLQQRLPVDEAKMKEELPKFTAEIRYGRQNEVFNNWFRKEVEKAAPTLPMLTKQQQGGPRG